MRRLGVLLLLVAGLGAAGTAFAHPEPGDVDGDGVRDEFDNCPQAINGDQQDIDGDRLGDRCDTDADADTVPNSVPRLWAGDDNCPLVPNPGQEAAPEDPQYGVACYVDTDGDGLVDPEDNCPELANAAQVDYDYDDWGDDCDPDDDEDGEFDAVDNCRLAYNYDQTDRDGDGIGAACDSNDAPATGASPPPPPPPPDRAAPSLGLTMPRTLRLREHGRSIAVEVRCSEQCAIRAELIVKRKKVAAGSAALGGRGTTYVFMRKLRRLRPARATLRLTATDPAGNVSRTTRRISVKR
jgi:Thrombospondin type 3 repeat